MITDSIRIAISGDAEACIELLSALHSLPESFDIRCVAAATGDMRDHALREALGSLPNDIALYLRTDELLENETVDVFLIASPLPERHRNVQSALYAACHVLVTFPHAVTVRAAVNLQKTAGENDRLLAVCKTCRFMKKALMLRWAVAERIIGRLQYVLDTAFGSEHISPNKCIGDDPGLHDLGKGGGILFRSAMADFAFLRFVFGDIVAVQGQHSMLERERVIEDEKGGIIQRFSCHGEDTLSAQIRFSNNACGVYLRSWCGRPPLKRHSLNVWGERGTIQDQHIIPESGASEPLEEEWKKNVGPKQLATRFPGNITDPLTLELIDFLSAVRQWEAGKRPRPPNSAKKALRDLSAAWAAVESHATGKRLLVSEIESLKTEKVQKTLNERWNIP